MYQCRTTLAADVVVTLWSPTLLLAKYPFSQGYRALGRSAEHSDRIRNTLQYDMYTT